MLYKKHILESESYRGGSTRKEGNKNIVKLSSNENPIGPSPKAMQAIKNNLELLHEYTHQDDSKLREALATHYSNTLTQDQFICANSGLEILDMICRAFLDPGLECIISTPTFLAYKNFAELQGATVIDIPLDPDDFSLDTKKILDAVTENTRIIFLSSPNNPTGSIIPKTAMDELIRHLPDDVVIVFDEVYRHFASDKNFVTAAEYADRDVNIIGLNSFSKAYGLAGMRIAYAYATAEIAAYINRFRRPFMINALSTAAAMAALKDTSHLLATQKMIRAEKRWLYDQLDDMQIHFWPSDSNFILLIPPYDNVEFANDMLDAGVMVRTTDVFGLPGCIRLSIGNHEANETCLKAMRQLISEKIIG
ncbi:MAG TPA: histidinol-phosphate transaminase [Puia sp.]|jgi:histidinol-phosphate aminotransferase|nr:histidinol-phosphate transaminase [Puia sp.]